MHSQIAVVRYGVGDGEASPFFFPPAGFPGLRSAAEAAGWTPAGGPLCLPPWASGAPPGPPAEYGVGVVAGGPLCLLGGCVASGATGAAPVCMLFVLAFGGCVASGTTGAAPVCPGAVLTPLGLPPRGGIPAGVVVGPPIRGVAPSCSPGFPLRSFPWAIGDGEAGAVAGEKPGEAVTFG